MAPTESRDLSKIDHSRKCHAGRYDHCGQGAHRLPRARPIRGWLPPWPVPIFERETFGACKEGRPEPIVAKISQETLAEKIGTTRARVSVFVNKFRKLGLIDYNGHLEIHSSLLNVVLQTNRTSTAERLCRLERTSDAPVTRCEGLVEVLQNALASGRMK
jgi:Crp-like helix-turn-helix domain